MEEKKKVWWLEKKIQCEMSITTTCYIENISLAFCYHHNLTVQAKLRHTQNPFQKRNISKTILVNKNGQALGGNVTWDVLGFRKRGSS